jgi:hypothetical protein
MKSMNCSAIFYLFASVVQVFGASPCNDSQYLELKKMHVDSMSQREYEYFMLKERYCNEDLNSVKEQNTQNTNALIGVRIEGTQNERLNDAPDLNRVRRYWDDRLSIYLDKAKQSALVFSCSPGVRTVSLFPEGAIEEEHGDLRAHMIQSQLTIEAKPNKMYLITFSFRCQPYKKTCGEDEWYFDITYKEVKEKSELERMAKHIPITKR